MESDDSIKDSHTEDGLILVDSRPGTEKGRPRGRGGYHGLAVCRKFCKGPHLLTNF